MTSFAKNLLLRRRQPPQLNVAKKVCRLKNLMLIVLSHISWVILMSHRSCPQISVLTKSAQNSRETWNFRNFFLNSRSVLKHSFTSQCPFAPVMTNLQSTSKKICFWHCTSTAQGESQDYDSKWFGQPWCQNQCFKDAETGSLRAIGVTWRHKGHFWTIASLTPQFRYKPKLARKHFGRLRS